MRINYNVSAMLSNNALSNNQNALSKSLERLSSGLKINHAKDNPAGLAMAKRMNAQIRGLETANQNSGDGISVIETADGALTEVASMLQRMNELSVKSATGTLTDDDRQTIQNEVEQLKEEITRISNDTEFNGQKLLNGEFTSKGYTNNLDVKVNSYGRNITEGIYTIDSITISKDADGKLSVDGDPDFGDGFPGGCRADMRDNLLFITNDDGFELTLEVPDDAATYSDLNIDVTGIGSMRLQVGANEGQVLEVEIPAVTLLNMGIRDTDVSTKEGADEAIERISGAIDYVSSVRGRLGAYQNRLESTVNSLDITSESMTAAYSRIMDVDMAEEMTQYTTMQILTQAGTSMLAQANERPSQMLQLLQ